MESVESYKVITSNLTKILASLKIKNFSLLDIYAENNYLLGDLISSFNDKLKEIVVVGDLDIEFAGEKRNISTEDWETNTELLAERLKNSVVIYNKVKLNNSDFEKNMAKFSSFFPLMFIISSVAPSEQEDWRMQKLPKDVYLYLNKNIKTFKSFLIRDLASMKDVSLASLSSTSYSYSRGEEEIEIVLEQPKSAPVTRKKPNQINLSMFDNLPVPSVKPDPNSKVFMREFYSYLYQLLGRMLPPGKEKMLPFLLNKKTITQVWLRAFTHETYKPDKEENYESLETLGDKLQEYTMIVYYLKRFPTASEKDLTNVKQQILKTEFQGLVSDHLKLAYWANLPEKLRDNQKTQEDLFESLAGALDMILNEKSNSVGQAANILYYVFENMFDDYDFQEELKGPDRNFVEQLIKEIRDVKPRSEKTFHMKKPADISADIWEEILECGNQILLKNDIDTPLSIHGNVENNGIDFVINKLDNSQLEAKVILNDYGSKVLAKHGKNIKAGTILGKDNSATSRPAKNNAFDNARQYLIKKGITPEWRDIVKRKKTAAQLEGLDLALAKARSENPAIVEVSVRSAKKLKKDQFYQVYGIDKNNKIYILDVFVSDDNARNNYQLAIDNYLEKN